MPLKFWSKPLSPSFQYQLISNSLCSVPSKSNTELTVMPVPIMKDEEDFPLWLYTQSFYLWMNVKSIPITTHLTGHFFPKLVIIKHSLIVPGTVLTCSKAVLLIRFSVINVTYPEVYRTAYSALENMEIKSLGQIFPILKSQ